MSIGTAIPEPTGGPTARTRGILWQTLVPLLLGSAVVIAVAGWAIYGVATSALEAEALARIRRHAEDRQAREQSRFTQVGERVQVVATLLARHWSGPAQPHPVATVAGFISPAAAEDPRQRRAFALATGLMAEAGDLLAGEGASLVVAMPGAWLTGHGPGAAELVDAMLPDDPVLLPAEREAIDGPAGLAWTRPFLEPASGRWQVSAIARSDLTGLGRAAAAQAFSLDELLSRLAATTTEEVHAAWDRRGRLLVRSAPAGGPPVAERAADDPVAGPIAAAAPWSADPAEVVAMPQGWIAVSRIAGPDITMATWYPRQRLAPGQRQVAVLALAGCAVLLAVQSLLLWLVLRRRVGRPLQELGSAARTLADGGRISIGTARRDELGDLARSFSRMAEAIAARESALRDAAEALRDRQQLLRAVLDGAADGVLILDDDRIVEANPRAEALFGLPRDRLVGCRPQDLSPAHQPDGTATADEVRRRMDLLAVHGRQHFPWRHRRADGMEFEAEIGLARIQGPGRELAVAVVRDVTERNRIEARLREGERMESLGRLAGGVAHDVNNMLAGILGCAELLRRPAADDGRRMRLTDTIITACERAAGLTRRLLTFSRRGAGPLAPADLHGLVREAVAMMPAGSAGGLRTALHLEAERSWILCDPAQVQNAILNLVINARDAMPEGGELRIATRTVHLDAVSAARFTPAPDPGEHIRIDVADTGSGIPPEVLPRIFEPFFTTKPAGRGTGLGLAAVYGTVAGLHGGLAVASRPGEGSVFSIVLPIAEPPVGRAVPPPPPATAGPRGVLLLVDDDAPARTVCAQLLREDGWEVVEAEDGATGSAAFAREPDRFAVVLLDMEMPVLRGDECLRRIRAVRPGVPALLISGFVGDVDGPEGPLAGFDGLVRKPFRLAELQEVLDGLRARR